MRTDVFHWKMSALANKRVIDIARTEIIRAHQDQTPLPIGVLTPLVPLKSQNLEMAAQRGDFAFTGDIFSNTAADELWLEFEDPVIKTFSVTLPAVWSGTVKLESDGSALISFDQPLSVEIERLSQLGVGRSRFQKVVSVLMTPEVTLTVLAEDGSEDKETWIEASIVPNPSFKVVAPRDVLRMRSFGSSTSCETPLDEMETDYNVLRRKGTTLKSMAFIWKGDWITGGMIAYDKLFGPRTKRECEEYIRNLPED